MRLTCHTHNALFTEMPPRRNGRPAEDPHAVPEETKDPEDDLAETLIQTKKNVEPRERPYVLSEAQMAILHRYRVPVQKMNEITSQEEADAVFRELFNRPTTNQVAFLRRAGIDVTKVKTKTLAHKIISKLKKDEKATARQLREIKRLLACAHSTHRVPDDLTNNQASEIITQLRADQKITDNQRRELQRRGVSHHRMPDLFVDAQRMIDRAKDQRKGRVDYVAEAFKDCEPRTATAFDTDDDDDDLELP